MFYSHTFLARKGPLSTVWIAAHLQHRLKKSHYAATDIPSTVLRIMDPGAPIALRMSGHLLLGVVRIYSKKVEYLHQDCKDALTYLHKAFATLQFVPLEESRPAPFQSVTLPQTFDLDAQNIDDHIHSNWSQDHHLRSLEDITLTDRVSVPMDHYVTVSFDEDIIMMDSSHTEVLPDSSAVPMEPDVNPQSPVTNVVGDEDHGPSTQRESPIIQHTGGMGLSAHSHQQATQPESIERVRGPNNSLENSPVFPGLEDNDARPNDYNQENLQVFPNREDDDAEPNIVLNQAMNDVPGLTHEELSVPSQSTPSRQQFGPPTPPTSQGGTLDAQVHGDNAPNFELNESVPRQQPQRIGRKRKQFFDNPIVLTNRLMRKAVNNTRDILRKRRDVPTSSLGAWKLNNSRRKELIFQQPLLTGVVKDLLDVYTTEHVRSRPHLIISDGDHADASMAGTCPTDQPHDDPVPATNQPFEEPIPATDQTPEDPVFATDQTPEDLIAVDNQTFVEAVPDSSHVAAFDMEVEHARNVAVTPPPTFPAHIVVEGDSRSFDRGGDVTMTSPHNISIASLSTNIASERMQTPGYAVSPSAHGSETMQTPDMDTHHLTTSAMTDELDFLLTMDNNISASSQGTSGSYSTLSERTRHVAKYLQRLSPITSILEEPAADLSMNQILDGKTRHIAARMFFEVLVLKSSELVDVQQEEPYGDISLKLVHTSIA